MEANVVKSFVDSRLRLLPAQVGHVDKLKEGVCELKHRITKLIK